jgi:hypothetical protein
MTSFFGSQAELGIVFHIGSSSIAAGLIRFKKGELPHVIYTLREFIPYQENLDPEKFFTDMIETLRIINERLAKEGLTHLKFTEFGELKVKNVYYVFSPPWSVTESKVATINKPEGFELTESMVNTLLEDQEHLFESETMGKADLNELLVPIEKRVIQIKLNGYEVANPYGKKARRADISIFVSIIPKAVLDKVFEVSMTTYHPKDTNVSTLLLASFSVLRDVFHEKNDFMLLDIGGEVSELSIIKNGLIVQNASIPLGRNFIVRRVAKLIGSTAEEAASLVKLYHEGHVDPIVEQKLKPDIEQASKEWMMGIRDVFSKLSQNVALPTTIFVLVYNDFVHLFMKALLSEKTSEFGISDFAMSAILIDADKLKSAVEFGKHADKDPFLAILSAFVGRMYDSKIK